MTSVPVKQQKSTRLEAESGRENLLSRYRAVRAESEALCRPIAVEDYGIQTMPDVSPPKWHIAHTTWFFETFLLRPYARDHQPFHPRFEYLFNSYYNAIGRQFPRAQRGLLSRPTVEQVYRYRAHVDAAMTELIQTVSEEQWFEIAARVTLGLHHEQQHQELFLTDLKNIFSVNPLRPAYRDLPRVGDASTRSIEWIAFPGGVREIGYAGEGFAYDNEGPRHRVYVDDYALASRTVTNGEYLEFMQAGGYDKAEFWLSDGWRTVQKNQWRAPLYWERIDGRWQCFTLSGMRPVEEAAPVCHVSLYEADAYARWVGKRLPSETEWELAAVEQPIEGNLRDAGYLEPIPATKMRGLAHVYGDVWEWTQSGYASYPGFRPAAGAIGEYNGKFMANQMVLRGGSCATPQNHIRPTYRNFFYPPDRWQFSGIRLAEDR